MTTIKYHTKEEALEAIIEDSANELKYCTPELQNDEEVVLAALKENSWSFDYASAELKSNKDFIMKVLHDGINPWGLIGNSNINIQSNLEVLTLAIEKSDDGWEFKYSKGEVAIDKELAAKALVKWGAYAGSGNLDLWDNLHPPLQEFFPKDSWYKKAQAYLYQLEQEKQAKLVSGGSTAEDEVVW